MNLKTYSYKKVNSTNEVAIRKIRNGISRGIIISDQQIKGKGRFGRKWISNKGNLFTTIFYPINKKINLYQLLKYNCDKIKKILKKKIKKTIIIKYPNDLLINGKKICGILQEIIEFKGEKYAVIGRLVFQDLFQPNENPVGKFINIDSSVFKVIGVFKDFTGK